MYFSQDEKGKKAYMEYKIKYEALFEQEYRKLCVDSKDPKYSFLSKEDIELINDGIKRDLEDRLWGSKI